MSLGWQGPLQTASTNILDALRRLLQCPEVFRPFVIVQAAYPPPRFVQFAGSTERGLLLDVPPLGIRPTRCPTPEDGVNMVLEGLRRQGVAPDDLVEVSFESSGARVPGVGSA